MAEDDPQKSGSSESSEPSEPSQTLPPQPIAPAQLAVAPQAWWQSAASNAPAAPAAPAGFPATGYPPQSGWWQTPGIGQPSYPAPGWPAAAWGVQSWYGPARYARPGPEPGIEWAGIGARFGALVVDAVLVFASVFVLGFVLAAFGLSSSSSETASSASSASSASPAATAISLVWLLFVMIYHPACWYVFGATVGQKALGLRVAQASNGGALGIGGVLVRFTIFAVVTLLIPLGIISAVMASNDPYKRAWHDEIARSVVVRRS